jgi:ABC-type Mn2+/Zn2+ transport system permease subunit
VILQFITLPLLAGLLLTAIHAYLGTIIVDRGEIVTALALTQMAAFGSALAVLLGGDAHDALSYLLTFAATILAATIFALTRDRRIPRETVAAIVFAVSAAATILAMSETAGEIEHLRDMLTGNILPVSTHTVAKSAVVFIIAAVAQVLARPRGFVFHALFGLAVTASITFAGVLLVFAYVTVPILAATLFAQTAGKRLVIAWTLGAIVTAIGVVLAFLADLPMGATIICVFGIAFLASALVRVLTRRHGTA